MGEDLIDALEPLIPDIRRHAEEIDQTGHWPAEDLETLGRAGILRMAMPVELGGIGASAIQQHLAYEAIARASMGVALILSQRDAAIGLIDASASPARHALLSELASNAFGTVGIAQLTTSRQGGAPALGAIRDGDGYRIDGLIPWCTGAAKATFIIAGAVDEAGRQLLFALRPEADGVKIDPPLPLVALRSTWTTAIRCEQVRIGPDDLLSGPASKVLVRGNNLPLGQAYLAMGLCRGAIDLIAEHRSEAARSASESFETQLSEIRCRVIELSDPARDREALAEAPAIRGRCNDLAVRVTHAAAALYKGTALLAGHPAQRLAREAMFLLVWSCPSAVIDCTVELLSSAC